MQAAPSSNAGKVSGVVESINPITTSYGTMYSITVNGNRYGTGNQRPSCNPGDAVVFNTALKGKYLNVVGEIEVTPRAARTDAIAATSGLAKVSDPRETPAERAYKQHCISKQSAINSATELLKIAQAGGFLPIPASGKNEPKLDLLFAIHAKLANDLYKFATVVTPPNNESPAADDVTPPEDDPWVN